MRTIAVGLVVAASIAVALPAASGESSSRPTYCPVKSHVLDGVYQSGRIL